MAKPQAVWGIDIGQSALKALRCVRSDSDSRIEATAFDFIEYPSILSQPDVNAADLIHDALKQFLSRNSIRGDKIAISVSGQAGLARFIKLPPVESSKIPDIVRYEAKQQIPFPLEDVVWDYQQMMGGSMTEGFALDSEVGLFAMKRDQAVRALEPFNKVDVEVDIVQLTPLALYNYLLFEQLKNLPTPDQYDPDNPPEYCVMLSTGTDNSDLVITNGYRVWLRSVPVGGSHFTKALTKELKMNFGTAEHLKRNAAQAEDPKALFQAMRPVFSDLLTELQRSLGYYKNLDKNANITRALALGNVMKLPGLQRYLSQNLGFELTRIESFKGLVGPGIVDAPAFKENLLAFGVCYGLTLQGLGLSQLSTNLLPREVMQERVVRAKKPYFVAAAAALLLGCGVYFFKQSDAVNSVNADPTALDQEKSFAPGVKKVSALLGDTGTWRQEFEAARNQFFKTDEVGRSMVQNVANRDVWAQLLKAVNLCLPRQEGERPKDVAARREIKIDAFECVWVPKLEDWYRVVKDYDKPVKKDEEPTAEETAPADGAAPVDPSLDAGIVADPNAGMGGVPEEPQGPTGPGWVVRITAHHYYSADAKEQGLQFVRDTLLANLQESEMPLPAEQQAGGAKTFPIKDMGIEHPVIIGQPLMDSNYELVVIEDDEAAQPMALGGGMAPSNQAKKKQPRQDFEIQFCWQPKSNLSKSAEEDAAPPGGVASN